MVTSIKYTTAGPLENVVWFMGDITASEDGSTPHRLQAFMNISCFRFNGYFGPAEYLYSTANNFDVSPDRELPLFRLSREP